MTHSRAPWYLSPTGRYIRYQHEGLHEPHGPNLADLEVFNGPDDERAANSRLIAAAPDLLAACKGLIAALYSANAAEHPGLHSDVVYAEAMIAKAEGGAS